MDELLSAEELATLSDDELVRLIMRRARMDEARAREALDILRGGPADDTIV